MARFQPSDFNEKSAMAVWTINDQRKLLSFKAFHRRFLEYHNNIHVKLPPRKSRVRDDGGESFSQRESDVAATVFSVQPDAGIENPTPYSKAQFTNYCQQLDVDVSDGEGFSWVHVKDLSCIGLLEDKYRIHELCIEGFEDVRAHSLLVPTSSGTLMSFCVHHMEGNVVTMYKLYIYMAKGVVVTFQTEILPDIDNPLPFPADTIIEATVRKCRKLILKGAHMGPVYLVYHLAQEALHIQDSCLEYFSTALSYFDKVVHLNLLHREKLDIMIKIHIISSAVGVMQRCIKESQTMISCFVNVALSSAKTEHLLQQQMIEIADTISPSHESNASAQIYANSHGLRRLLGAYLIKDEHIPYLIDLHDTYNFIHSCLSNVYNETRRIDEELDATISVRASNTNTVLSLIATTFLPMSFLAGVFGMNFQDDGGYSIGLLNETYGPIVFSMMCLFCFLCTSGYFISQGWVEIPILRYVHKRLAPEKIDDSKKGDSQAAAVRARDEETKRHHHAHRRRAYSSGSDEGANAVVRALGIRTGSQGSVEGGGGGGSPSPSPQHAKKAHNNKGSSWSTPKTLKEKEKSIDFGDDMPIMAGESNSSSAGRGKRDV